MRAATAVAVLVSAASAVAGLAWAQTHGLDPAAMVRTSLLGGGTGAAIAPDVVPPVSSAPPPAAAPPAPCANPGALGVSRVVEIDTTGGPGFGWEDFKMHDFLRDHEVVLTFDDGPWPGNTPAVLKALAEHCTKATFFPIGKHTSYHPEILRQVFAAGHTVGNHTWAHKDLSKKPYNNIELGEQEIEKGISAVRIALGTPGAPFFRFPMLRHPPALVTYLGQRNIAIFSTDMDSFDFTMRRPEQVIDSVMSKLEKHGKGIVLMHDFQHPTSEALPELLDRLKAGGYKIVHMQPKAPVQTLARYDDMVAKEGKLSTVSDRPTSAVVHTISK